MIATERLNLVPMTPSFLRACLDGEFAKASEIIGVTVPVSWVVNEAPLALRLAQLQANPTLQPWLLRAISLRSSREMIGFIGFHTAPGPACLEEWLPGSVEFGFTIFPPHRGNGYAHEASQGLMDWAEQAHGVTRFILTISPSNGPSQGLATRLGFVCIGQHMDEVDGVEDVLARVAGMGKCSGPSPKVLGVHLSSSHSFSKRPARIIHLLPGVGVEGDAHSGSTIKHRSRVARDPSQPNLRQVHLLHGELLRELQTHGHPVYPGSIGENITTQGLDILALPQGTRLRLGAEAVVVVTGLRNPCAQLDGFSPGLTSAVLDRTPDGELIRKAGIMAIVETGGAVRAGDGISVVLPTGAQMPLRPV